MLTTVSLTKTISISAYDLIIIPVPKVKPPIKTPPRPKKLLEVNLPKLLPFHHGNSYIRNDGPIKLDLEHYDEPTEMPDIDNFDYNKDRDNSKEHPRYDYNDYGEDKIVGGFEVDINLYPYHVAYGSNCGGAIIDKKWIITAGHCG